MHKRKLRYLLKRLRLVPPLLLLVVPLFFGAVSVFALRANNQRMIELRAAVFAADEQGGDVEDALRALREHVHAHMNTSLTSGDNAIRPPIQLKYTYERLVAAEQAKQSGNAGLITEAQEYCERTQPQSFYGAGRLDCIRQYLDEHGVQTAEAVDIPEDLYKFDFASPAWSPDLAGWSLVLTVVSSLAVAVRLLIEYAIRYELNR